MASTRFAPVALALSATLADAGNVIVVDDDGPADFTSLAAAVQAAGQGDTLLVRSGQYAGFAIDGKSLDVFVDHENVARTGPISVRNLAAGQRVVLSGLEARIDTGGFALEVVDCTGAVMVQDCTFAGGSDEPFLEDEADAVRMSNALCVVFDQCLLEGAPGNVSEVVGGRGLAASASRAYVLRSTVRGGRGWSESGHFGLLDTTAGGVGIDFDGGTLFLEGAVVEGGRGGAGGSGLFSSCTAGGSGGTGLLVDGLAGVFTKDVTIAGGLGGPGGLSPPFPPCPLGPSGQAVVVVSGTMTDLPVTARGFGATVNPVREGGTTSAVFTGKPGDVVLLVYGVLPECGVDLFFQGADLVQTLGLFVAGNIGADGTLTLPFVVQDFHDPLLQVVNVYEQALFFDLAEGWVTGPARVICHLDASF